MSEGRSSSGGRDSRRISSSTIRSHSLLESQAAGPDSEIHNKSNGSAASQPCIAADPSFQGIPLDPPPPYTDPIAQPTISPPLQIHTQPSFNLPRPVYRSQPPPKAQPQPQAQPSNQAEAQAQATISPPHRQRQPCCEGQNSPCCHGVGCLVAVTQPCVNLPCGCGYLCVGIGGLICCPCISWAVWKGELNDIL